MIDRLRFFIDDNILRTVLFTIVLLEMLSYLEGQ